MSVVPQRLQQWHCADLQSAPRCKPASQRSADVAVVITATQYKNCSLASHKAVTAVLLTCMVLWTDIDHAYITDGRCTFAQ